MIKIVMDLKEKDIILNDSGIYTQQQREKLVKVDKQRNIESHPITEFTLEEIQRNIPLFKIITQLIPLLVVKTSKKYLCHSYTFKHILEDITRDKYVSNGQAILAMMYMGYKYKIQDSINLTFQCNIVDSDYTRLRSNTNLLSIYTGF